MITITVDTIFLKDLKEVLETIEAVIAEHKKRNVDVPININISVQR